VPLSIALIQLLVNVVLVVFVVQLSGRLLNARRSVYHLLRSLGVVETVVPGNVTECDADSVNITEAPGGLLAGESISPLIVFVKLGSSKDNSL
jgi:hypothetical protein